MPNRIIKESLCTSEKIAGLSDFEFRLWIGLITQADDCGRGDARSAVIKGRVFPFRERLAIKDIDAALHGLADKGCVGLYTVDGKPYFYFPTWTEHQRVRDCKPKYPPPEFDNPPQAAASCGELPRVAAIIQSNPNPNPNPKSACAQVDLSGFCESMQEALRDWLSYKKERRQEYKPTGLRNFLAEAKNNVAKYGDEAVVSAIRQSMAANYQGVVWDKAKTPPKPHAMNYPQRQYTENDLSHIGVNLLED